MLLNRSKPKSVREENPASITRRSTLPVLGSALLESCRSQKPKVQPTWDYAASNENYHEMDIEISRWGDPAGKNAQYVRQPYYVPANVERFMAPAGTLTHSFQWESGRLSFRTVRGSGRPSANRLVAERVLTTGIPSPAIESVRISLYYFRDGYVPLKKGAEVVIEKFEYLP